MPNRQRRIAHLDMDAFYASVELLRYPELRGQAVVIGGRSLHQPTINNDGTRAFAKLRDYAGRGVVTTSTYEARALGVFSAMGMMKAAKLAVREIAPQIEDRGIDEIYIDLTELPQDSVLLAQQIKQAVREATGLSCSIGIAPNKLLAKIGSELDKPDGITLLTMDDVPTRIWPMAVRKINGIGPKATEKLAALGIQTIGELAKQSKAYLAQYFGSRYSEWLYHAARGLDDRPVITSSEPKSISRETTFERDLHVKTDRAKLFGIFSRLCLQVSGCLRR